MHATRKYLQRLMGPAISGGNFKLTKPMYHLTCLAKENFKNSGFILVAQM